MWECDYAGEPVNRRLLFLRFLGKIWVLALGTVAGIVLIAGAYYMSKMVFGQGRTYQAETVFYVDYADSVYKQEYVYFNYYTWNEIIHMDYFVDSVYSLCGGRYSKDEIVKYVTASVESDVRFVYVRCQTGNPEESLYLAGIVKQVMLNYPEKQKEIQNITVEKNPAACTDSTNLRMPTAVLLGALLGFLASGVILLCYLVGDSSVYLPETLEKRYGIVCLGAVSLPEFAVNKERLTKGDKKLSLIPAEMTAEAVKENIVTAFGANAAGYGNIIADPQSIERLEDSEVILVVKSGAHNGRMIDRTLEQLKRLNITVKAFVLTEEDRSLIDRYYKK